jgi:hypothetical protein
MTVEALSINPSYEGIFSMVDTCVMLQEKRIETVHVRRMYIMKSRGINNSKEEKEFIITDKENTISPNNKMVISNNENVKKTPITLRENKPSLSANLSSIAQNENSKNLVK